MHSNSRRNTRTQSSLSWTWLIAVWIVLWLLILKWLFGSSSDNESAAKWYLIVTPSWVENSVSISMSNNSKVSIQKPEKLFASDKSVTVNSWGIALAENDFMKLDLDGNTELSYISAESTENTLWLSKWRAWVISKIWPVVVQLKNLSVRIGANDIVFIEQNNAYSIAYAIKWNSLVSTSIGTYSLEPGNRIMIWASDLTGTAPLSSLAWPIDESIMQNTLFIRNNGDSYLNQIHQNSTWWLLNNESTSSWAAINTKGAFIEITDPSDGSVTKSATISVMGKILSKEVKRVTINDKDASISPVNESFILQGIAADKDILNLVYKAYDSNNSLLEKWVIVVFGQKWGNAAVWNSLVSNNFPLSNKDFKITFPQENPYKTTDSLVKVQGSVPKDTVAYIVVNDYKLQKFVPNSTIWYYYANTDTKSMVDGINLYTIKFYWSDDTLLYSQLFTIVKESKNGLISGEVTR